VKKIEAIIRPEMLPVVRQALDEIGVTGITITQILGHGAQKGVTRQWKGTTYKVDLIQKIELKTVVPDDKVDAVLKAIRESASTGLIGDGKVFVSNVEDAMRVRTGERGEGAI
jgi:nitrogen regulatory protein P-II 1